MQLLTGASILTENNSFDAGPLADLAQNILHEVNVDGSKVLLVRDGETIYAVSGICPHAGAPLAEGVRHGDSIICPWHKASFCLRTGAVLEPPALDPIERFKVTVVDGRINLSRPEPTPATQAALDHRVFLIIGAGAAGAVAAQTLRQEGFGGRVVMLDRENRVPYDRTILSKYALSGEKGAEKTPLQSQAFYKQHRIERVTATVSELDVATRNVTCSDGSTYTYDAALLATGSAPTRPNIPGIDLDGVFFLRSRSDANAILERAERSQTAIIMGASFIGMEVAASLTERGLDVTVIGREKVPFEKILGPEIGRAIQRLHETKGVTFRLGSQIREIQGGTNGLTVLLKNGEEITADLIVVGFGNRPETSHVNGVPQNDDGSLTVDTHLAIAPNLYAAGDIARFPEGGGGALIRVEHWRIAEQQGRIAALNMLGQTTVFKSAPVFWTIQYLKRVDYIGYAATWDEIVIHGDLTELMFLAYFVSDGVVRAAAGMGRDKDTAALAALFDLRQTWSSSELGENPASLTHLLLGTGRALPRNRSQPDPAPGAPCNRAV